MRTNRWIAPWIVFFMGVTLVGCNLPINTTPTPFVFPTPNLTMTAIFSLPVLVTPTAPASGEAPTNAPVAVPTGFPELPTVTNPSSGAKSPTATQSSTSTAVPAASTAKAAYLSTPPTIDGNWNDWTTTQYPIGWVVLGLSKWQKSADLSGAYRIGWDNNNLYLAVKVNDNVYSQLSKGTNLYKGDSIEILLNTNLQGASSTQGLTENDFQLGISPGNPAPGDNPEAYLWFPEDKAGGQTNVKIGALSTSGGYRVEASIPWSVFGVTPSAGQQYGFALSVSDDDQPNTAVQEKMLSTASKRSLTDPTTWGVLTLSQ